MYSPQAKIKKQNIPYKIRLKFQNVRSMSLTFY